MPKKTMTLVEAWHAGIAWGLAAGFTAGCVLVLILSLTGVLEGPRERTGDIREHTACNLHEELITIGKFATELLERLHRQNPAKNPEIFKAEAQLLSEWRDIIAKAEQTNNSTSNPLAQRSAQRRDTR